MITIYPGQGIGVTNRPVLGFTLGYYPVGSVLAPVHAIISDEFLGQVASREPENVTSLEPDNLISFLEEMLIESVEPSSVVSSESYGEAIYGEEIGFTIIDFGALAQTWGGLSVLTSIAQTGSDLPFMVVTAVTFRMRNVFGATDVVTLELRSWSPTGIPEDPPTPINFDVITSVSVDAADIPVGWTDIRFEFDEPLVFPSSWSLMLTRTVPSDTSYLGIYFSTEANYPNGGSVGNHQRCLDDRWNVRSSS